jgi:DNA-binding response OmpR family regulator
VREPEPWQWQLGSRRFVPAEGRLYDQGKRIALTAAEVRLLRRLCLVSGTEPPGRLTVEQLAWELGGKATSRVSSARNYITQLRRKLGDDPKKPVILRRDRDGYWVILGLLPEPLH